jgi:hypothetical protein
MTWSIDAIAAAHGGLLSRLGDGEGDPTLTIYRVGGDPLIEIVIDVQASSVDQSSGQVTLTPAQTDPPVLLTGTATDASLHAGDGVLMKSGIPVVEGSDPVSGSVVMNAKSVTEGDPVMGISIRIG